MSLEIQGTLTIQVDPPEGPDEVIKDSLDESLNPVASRLESGGRILSLIRKAEKRSVAKRKIIDFLKRKGVSEKKIIESYQEYYNEENLYEITFNEKPLGFSVIMDTRGKNAIVSSIQDKRNEELGMKVASRMYEINGKRVDDMKHKEILKILTTVELPFYIIFRESRRKNRRLDKVKKVLEVGWKEEKDDEEVEEDVEEENDPYDSYSSDDDEAHVAKHHTKKMKEKSRGRTSKSGGVFKPNELEEWDDATLEGTREEMMKELARLMLDTTAKGNPTDDSDLKQMTHKRQKTLKKLLDVQSPSMSRQSQSMNFSVNDLMEEEDTQDDVDSEIFQYLSDLMGGDGTITPNASLTPNTQVLVRDLFVDLGDDDGSISFNQDLGQSGSPQPSNFEEVSNIPVDVMSAMKSGTTLMKYGRFGRPKYRMFQLSPDHKYLVWFSTKKDSNATRIPIIDIRKILIGEDSNVTTQTDDKELQETSFTITYGKDDQLQSLTVSAKNPTEAYVWAQGLKILSDAAKSGKNVSEMRNLDINLPQEKRHQRQGSVIISMDKVQRQSLLKVFGKNSESSKRNIKKQAERLKDHLNKCVEFVLTKSNWKILQAAGEFENIKQRLEEIDGRVRDVDNIAQSNNDIDVSAIKAEMFSINADLDALKQKLTVLVRKPQQL